MGAQPPGPRAPTAAAVGPSDPPGRLCRVRTRRSVAHFTGKIGRLLRGEGRSLSSSGHIHSSGKRDRGPHFHGARHGPCLRYPHTTALPCPTSSPSDSSFFLLPFQHRLPFSRPALPLPGEFWRPPGGDKVRRASPARLGTRAGSEVPRLRDEGEPAAGPPLRQTGTHTPALRPPQLSLP